MNIRWYATKNLPGNATRLIHILISFTILVFSSPTHANQGRTNCLNVRQISVNPDLNSDPNYEPGRELYPKYSYHGLPDNFLVKRIPDISINSIDISLIKIKKMQFSSSSGEVYTVTIYLDSTAARKMQEYTMENLGKKVALETAGKIFVVVTIVNVISDELNITLLGKDIDEVEMQLRKLSQNIVVDNSKTP